MNNNLIGITERGDPQFDHSWIEWVESGKPAIIITKNPLAIHNFIKNMKDINVIIHCTITGYGGTVLEPNVINPKDALIGYGRLISLLGISRVILRIDPVVPTTNGIERAKKILAGSRLFGDGSVRISFMDMYPHVIKRFKEANVPLPYNTFHAPLQSRLIAWEMLNRPSICCEPDMKVDGCISQIECTVLNVNPIDRKTGQRTHCNCLANKYELLKNKHRCPNFCLYCYWKDKN